MMATQAAGRNVFQENGRRPQGTDIRLVQDTIVVTYYNAPNTDLLR
jgi:hypothetical protein